MRNRSREGTFLYHLLLLTQWQGGLSIVFWALAVLRQVLPRRSAGIPHRELWLDDYHVTSLLFVNLGICVCLFTSPLTFVAPSTTGRTSSKRFESSVAVTAAHSAPSITEHAKQSVILCSNR